MRYEQMRLTSSSILWAYILIILTCAACKTAEPIHRDRIPTTQTTAPGYVADAELAKDALQIKKELLKEPNNTAKLERLASLYIELKDAPKAIASLEKLKTLNYKDNPKVYSSLGKLYADMGSYREAQENYRIFKDLVSDKPSVVSKTDQVLSLLEFKISVLSHPYEINLRRFSSDVNTTDSEYLSQFTIDDQQLIFTRRHHGQEDLYIARRTSAGYDITAIDAVNTPLNEGAHTVSSDGSTLIFTHCNEKFGFGGCDLYSSYLRPDGQWSMPANLGSKINTRHWEAQPSLSSDGQELYFSSTKPEGSFGGADIWVSKKQKDRTWGTPQNVGSQINTNKKEESPFIHADRQTLYFRTNGHPSLGSYDLYKASKTKNGWKDIQHLGSPINTEGNDGALVVSLDGTRGYYASDTYEGIKSKHLDIFEFALPNEFRPLPMTYIKGRITDETTSSPLSALIEIAGDSVNPAQIIKSNYNGEFLIAIPVGAPTHLHVSKSDYVFFSDYIQFDDIRYGIDPHLLNIALKKATITESIASDPQPVLLPNIFFASGSATLLAKSQSELKYLYSLLDENPNIKIEILGHTDNVGTEDDNISLSLNRAQAIKDALVRLGASPKRITPKGLGELQPIATNETEEGRAQNRRTELIIIQ